MTLQKQLDFIGPQEGMWEEIMRVTRNRENSQQKEMEHFKEIILEMKEKENE